MPHARSDRRRPSTSVPPPPSTAHGTALADLAVNAVEAWTRSPSSWTDVRARFLADYGPAALPVLARAFTNARHRLLLDEEGPTTRRPRP